MNDTGASKLRVRYMYRPRRSLWAVYRETDYRWPDGDVYTEGEKVAEYATREEAEREVRRRNLKLKTTNRLNDGYSE